MTDDKSQIWVPPPHRTTRWVRSNHTGPYGRILILNVPGNPAAAGCLATIMPSLRDNPKSTQPPF